MTEDAKSILHQQEVAVTGDAVGVVGSELNIVREGGEGEGGREAEEGEDKEGIEEGKMQESNQTFTTSLN